MVWRNLDRWWPFVAKFACFYLLCHRLTRPSRPEIRIFVTKISSLYFPAWSWHSSSRNIPAFCLKIHGRSSQQKIWFIAWHFKTQKSLKKLPAYQSNCLYTSYLGIYKVFFFYLEKKIHWHFYYNSLWLVVNWKQCSKHIRESIPTWKKYMVF